MGTRDTRGRKLRAVQPKFSDYFFRCHGNGLRGTPRKRWVSFSASGEKLVNRPRPWQARNDTGRCVCLRTTFMVQGNSPSVGLLHLSVLPSVKVLDIRPARWLGFCMSQNSTNFEQAEATSSASLLKLSPRSGTSR